MAVVKEAKPDMLPYVSNGGNTSTNFKYGFWMILEVAMAC